MVCNTIQFPLVKTGVKIGTVVVLALCILGTGLYTRSALALKSKGITEVMNCKRPINIFAFTKWRKAKVNFVMFVCLSAWKNAAPTGRIFMTIYLIFV